jgi:hypothetical protein
MGVVSLGSRTESQAQVNKGDVERRSMMPSQLTPTTTGEGPRAVVVGPDCALQHFAKHRHGNGNTLALSYSCPSGSAGSALSEWQGTVAIKRL